MILMIKFIVNKSKFSNNNYNLNVFIQKIKKKFIKNNKKKLNFKKILNKLKFKMIRKNNQMLFNILLLKLQNQFGMINQLF